MLLEGILSISGQQGLFKLISKGNHNIIVESFITGKRMPAFSTSRISTLEDVAIFAESEDVPLKDVFIKVYDKFGTDINVSGKSKPEELKKFLEEILPDYDKDRVYVSDIKKLVVWYQQLVEHNVINEENVLKEKEEQEKENQDTNDNNDTEEPENK